MFIILSIIIFVILVILAFIPGIGPLIGGSGGIVDSVLTVGFIAMMFFCTILTLYRVYKRKLSLKSPYVWFCYILYSIFVPAGSFVTAYELA